MSIRLSLEQVRLLRLRAQRLHPEISQDITDPGKLLRELCVLQAQELPSATLAVRPRGKDLLAGDVRRAREDERSIVLTWCMRGTLHLVSTADLGWLLPFFGPLFIRKTERRYRQLGLSQEIRKRAGEILRDVLASRGPLTRPEIAVALADKGIPVQGQAIAHLVRYAALEGIICFGPEREGDLTYVLLEEWVRLGGSIDPAEVHGRLAHRYLDAYGPAAPEDLASWAGISIRHARAGFKAISGDLLEIDKTQMWMLKEHAAWLEEPPGDTILRLLPRYDTYLLGYQNRDFMVSEAHARHIHPGGGMIKSSLIVDGRAIAIWRFDRKRKETTIVVEPFEALNSDLLPALEAEVQDIARFLGEKISLRLQSS